MEKIFLNKETFSKEVEKTVYDLRIGYTEAIVHLCEENNIEIESVKGHINNVIKTKLEAEARELNYLPTYNKLPGF